MAERRELVQVVAAQSGSRCLAEREGSDRVVPTHEEQRGDTARHRSRLDRRQRRHSPDRALLGGGGRWTQPFGERAERIGGFDLVGVCERMLLGARHRQSESFGERPGGVDVLLRQGEERAQVALEQSIDHEREHPYGFCVVQRGEQATGEIVIVHFDGHRSAIDRAEHGRGQRFVGRSIHQPFEILAEARITRVAVGVARARGDQGIDGLDEPGRLRFDEIDLRRIRPVEDHRLEPLGPVAHHREREP